MNMGFEIVRGVQFGFDVGGTYVPPEPGEDVGVLGGTIMFAFFGSLAAPAEMEIINGIATVEE